MTSPKYPLCARAGLIPKKIREEYPAHTDMVYMVRAADVEKMLEGAPIVRARLYDNEVFGEWFDKAQEQDTHTARLVMIEPIAKDTPESLLKELTGVFARSWKAGERDMIGINDNEKAWDLLDRAHRLLEGK